MKPNKLLGQHFLTCDWVTSSMIDAAEVMQRDTVLEIGPGTGVLTQALAKRAKQVVAVEKDEHLASQLQQHLSEEGIKNTEMLAGDILKVLPHLTHKLRATSYKLVSNIPYYLTSHLLRVIFEQKKLPSVIVLTVQKEVAERITEVEPHMSLLSLSVNTFGIPKIVDIVPKECFYPKPKVDSAILKIVPRKYNFFSKHQIEKEEFFSVVRKAFGQKRKTIGHSLGLRNINIPENLKQKRPQELSLGEWVVIYRALETRFVEHPQPPMA